MDLIDRQALLGFLDDITNDEEWLVTQYNADWIYSWIDCEPAVDAEPVKHGRWIDNNPDVPDWSYRKGGMSYYCSNCKHLAGKYKHNTYKYCPWCGAKMDLEG